MQPLQVPLRRAGQFLPSTDVRWIKWSGASLTLISLIWLFVCIRLYTIYTGYQASELYEARWLPGIFSIMALFCFVFCQTRSSLAFISTALAAQYGLVCAIVAIFIYTLDFVKLSFRLGSVNIHTAAGLNVYRNGHIAFAQSCLCMCLVSGAGLFISLLILYRVFKLSYSHFEPLPIAPGQKRILQLFSAIETGLAVFSIYVTIQVLAFKSNYGIRTYLVQELYCSLLLFCLALVQTLVTRGTNRLLLNMLLIGNICQFIQEVSHAWTAYYVSVYMHSVRVNIIRRGMHYDQLVMTLNFLSHCFRMMICAYAAYSLANSLRLNLIRRTINNININNNNNNNNNFPATTNESHPSTTKKYSRSVIIFGTCIAVVSLVLGSVHVLLDMTYAAMEHIYRTLLASTGIAVFYANLIGIAFSLFIRFRAVIWLAMSCSLCILLTVTSLHGLYIYLQTTFTGRLLNTLRLLSFDNLRGASHLHFLEALLSLIGFLLGITSTGYCLGLMRAESVYRPKRGGNNSSNAKLFGLLKLVAVVNFAMTFLEILCLFRIKLNWKLTDAVANHGFLDGLSMLSVSALQLYVASDRNSHFEWTLIALIFQLLIEVLTTESHLSGQTSYVQFMLTFYRAHRQSGISSGSKLIELFPVSELRAVLIGHFIQPIQWILVTISLLISILIYENLEIGNNNCQSLTTDHSMQIPTVTAGYSNLAFDSNTVTNCTDWPIVIAKTRATLLPAVSESPSLSNTTECINNGRRSEVSSVTNASACDHESL